MTAPVRLRRLTDHEGSTSSVRYRRAMMLLLASAGGNRMPVIAQLVQADEDTVRNVIHRFNEIGLAALDPQSAGGRPAGEVLHHVVDPVQFGFALGVGGLLPRPGALEGDATSGGQAAQGLAAYADDAVVDFPQVGGESAQ